MEINKRTFKLNIQQLAERTGYSADKIDLLIQEGLVSKPESLTFNQQHIDELEIIRSLANSGATIECGRHKQYHSDQAFL